jgi:hypothetical protein
VPAGPERRPDSSNALLGRRPAPAPPPATGAREPEPERSPPKPAWSLGAQPLPLPLELERRALEADVPLQTAAVPPRPWPEPRAPLPAGPGSRDSVAKGGSENRSTAPPDSTGQLALSQPELQALARSARQRAEGAGRERAVDRSEDVEAEVAGERRAGPERREVLNEPGGGCRAGRGLTDGRSAARRPWKGMIHPAGGRRIDRQTGRPPAGGLPQAERRRRVSCSALLGGAHRGVEVEGESWG